MQPMQETLPKAIALRIKEADEQVLIHDEINRNIHVVNHTAAAILKLCDGQHSLEAIVEIIGSDADVPKAQIRADVARLLAQFAERGLLEHAV
jgi:hypothetical protein